MRAIATDWLDRSDEAEALWAEYHAQMLERGLLFEVHTRALHRGLFYMRRGRYGEAERVYRESWDELGRMGEHGYRSTIGCELARALAPQGRVEEARAVLAEAESICPEGDWVTISTLDWAGAFVAHATGADERAVELMENSLAVARQREYVDYLTELWFDYGRFLAAAGRADEAREAFEEVVRLAEMKESRIYLDKVREELAQITAGT